MANKIDTLKSDIAEMEEVFNDSSTPADVKKALEPAIKKAKEELAEIEKKSEDKKPSATPKKSKGYKLGDMYSSDFDYEGMLEMALTTNKSWSKKDLRKLFDSFEDVNYHTPSQPLWDAINNSKNDKEVEENLKKFHKLVKDELGEVEEVVVKKEEPKKKKESTSALQKCKDLLEKYQEKKKNDAKRLKKRAEQGKPIELTPAETVKKSAKKVEAKIINMVERTGGLKASEINQLASGIIETIKSTLEGITDTTKKHRFLKEIGKEIHDLEKHLPKAAANGMYMEDGGRIADSNKEMILSNIHSIKHHADEINEILKQSVQVEAWVNAKAERAATDLSDITHYLDGELHKFEDGGEINELIGQIYRPFNSHNEEYYVTILYADFDRVEYSDEKGSIHSAKAKDFFDSYINVSSYHKKGGLLNHYNTGRSWHLDRAKHNNSESWENRTFEDGGRIEEMVEHWSRCGWAGSHIYNNDSEFFEKIGKTSMEVPTTSFTGNDIKYYDEDRVDVVNGGFKQKFESGGTTDCGCGKHKFEDGGEVKKNMFDVGDVVSYKTGDIEMVNWYGVVSKVLDLGNEFAYRIDAYSDTQMPIMFDSSKHNEKYEISLKRAAASKFEYLRRLYNEQSNRMFSSGGMVARNILEQLGGAGKLKAMVGAYNFIDTGRGLSFRIKNPKANYIKITLNSMDLYDLEIGKIRGMDYKIVAEQNNLYYDQLKPIIEKVTGMYLTFAEGGEIEWQYFEVTHYPSNSEPYITYEKQWVGQTKPNNAREISKEDYEHFSKYEVYAKGGEIKKGDKYIINLDGKNEDEQVTVISDFKAGKSQVDFITLKRDVGANYYITLRRFEKSIVKKLEKGGDVYAKGGYISSEEYRDKLEAMTDNELLAAYCDEYGFDIEEDDHKERIEEERDMVIDDMVERYQRYMKSTGRMAKGGDVWNAENIYKMANDMTDEEYERKYSELSKSQKDSVQRLIRLGDSPQLALATIYLKKDEKINSETWDLYRYAKGGEIDPLEKELHKLLRELNSKRLSQYMEGDESEEEKNRQKEREVKLKRFNEVLELLKEKENKKEKGGKVSFKDKVKAISSRLEGTKVKPKYQKQYGKTYNKAESVEAATKIAGKQVAKSKMAKGGSIQRKGTYTGKIVETESGSVMIGKISGYRGNGEPVYDVHEYGELRKDIREKKGELSNSKIKELLKNK